MKRVLVIWLTDVREVRNIQTKVDSAGTDLKGMAQEGRVTELVQMTDT